VLVDECTIGDDEGSSSHAFYFKMHSKYESDAFSIDLPRCFPPR